MSIADNLKRLYAQIDAAKAKSEEPNRSIDLVAVSKQHSPDKIREAYTAGVRLFGENRVQELVDKAEELHETELSWHFIGHLQTNKVRQIVRGVDLIHSLDRPSLAKELNKRALQHERTINALVQVNMAGETQKFGMDPEDVLSFLESMEKYPALQVQGLMFMAPNAENKEEVRPYFRKTKELFDTIAERSLPQVRMTHLSMGMSGDFHIAIEEGATMIRIGTAVFQDGAQ